MHRTNSKIPPLKQSAPTQNFTFSIKSKKQPFLLSHSKSIRQQNQDDQPEVNEVRYFPVEIYKDMLKGQKIYIQMYYRDKPIESGYEPYIEAMGGQVTKRVCPSTTIVLTGIMTKERYTKLKAKVEKICKPETRILSIIWLQQIYRQKRKVQKESYIFDQQSDIIPGQNDSESEQDPMPDYFEREIFQIDFRNDLENFLKNCDDQLLVKIEDNKKFRDKQGQQFFEIIQPQKYELFSEFDEDQFKIYKNRKGYKYFWPQNKEKQKKRNRSSVDPRKPAPEKEKKPRASIIIRKSQKEKVQKRKTQGKKTSSLDEFLQQLGSPSREKAPQKKIIPKQQIENYQRENQNVQENNVMEVRKSERIINQEEKLSNPEKKSKIFSQKSSNLGEKSKPYEDKKEKQPSKRFEEIGKLRPMKPEKNSKDSNRSWSSDGEDSQANFLKRIRQRKQGDESFETAWNKLISKSRLGSQNLLNTKKVEPSKNESQASISTPPKSQSELTQKTITAPKHGSKQQ